MNTIPADELLQWSIFKCKICRNRLQTPIMLVRNYGNTCGTCYERSDYTNAIHNIELEKLLSKLHVSCNYKERGCTHDGSYNNTCEHEKRCCFRDRMCPFAFMDTCEKTLTNFYDMAGHISNRHKKNVLTVEKNCSVVIQNPTITNRDIFYLLSVDKKDLLLRTWMDTKEEYIYYVFYYFKDDIALKNTKFSFNMRCENTIFTVESVNVNIQHESTIRSKCDTENAVKIPLATLKYLSCLESVEVSISIDGDSLKSSTNVEEFKAQSAWISCNKCSRIIESIYYCKYCKVRRCLTCIKVNAPCSVQLLTTCNFQFINLTDWKLICEIPCENSGCSQILKGDEYNKHKDQCLFKKLVCPLQNDMRCNWQGLLKEMADHLKSLHTDFVNKNVYYRGEPKIFFFLKGDDIFKQEYELASNGDLSIITTKLTTPVWDDSYRWEFHMKRTDVPMTMIITDVCTEQGCKKTINVENYLEDGKFVFYADIKHHLRTRTW